MTWYEDVDKRLDGLDESITVLQKVVARLLREVGIVQDAPEGAPAGEPPARSVSAVTPVAEDAGDESDEAFLAELPALPPNRCKHQHQRLDQATKRIACAQCGTFLTEASGLLQQGVVTRNGQVATTVPADQLPDWARAARETAQE